MEWFWLITENDCKNECNDFTNPDNEDSQYFLYCVWWSSSVWSDRDVLETKPWCYIQKDWEDPTDPINYKETEEQCLSYCQQIAEDDWFDWASCYYGGEVIADSVQTQITEHTPECWFSSNTISVAWLGSSSWWSSNWESWSYDFNPDSVCKYEWIVGTKLDVHTKASLTEIIDWDWNDWEFKWKCYWLTNWVKDTSKSITCSMAKTESTTPDYSSSTCNGDIKDSCRMWGFSWENREDIWYVDLTDSSTQYKWKCWDVTCTKDKETSVSTTSYDCEAQSFDWFSLIGTNNNNSITLSWQKFKCSNDKWYVKCSNWDYEKISWGSSIDSVCPADSWTSEEDITELYWDLLWRAPNSEWLTYRLNSWFTTSQIESSIKESDEYQIIELYWDLLWRAPASEWLTYRLNSWFSISQIESSIKESDEYQSTH